MSLGAAILTTTVPISGVYAANVKETPGLQLQTILIDNDGKNWTTESWGGANLTPNTNWTNLTIRDYYENGYLNFRVRNTEKGSAKFKIGLMSHFHNENVRIFWNDLPNYQNITAVSDWTSYSLPIKELVDAFPDSGFDLNYFWYVSVSGTTNNSILEFRDVTITSTDDERQYPIIKVNQVGYDANGTKTARISCFEKFGSLNGKTYQIVNADNGDVAYEGTLSDAKLNEHLSGESMHIINFNDLTTPGNYYIRIQNAGLLASARSPRDVEEGLDTDTITSVTFKIENNVYEDMLSDLTKYYYYQRQGIDLDEKYAGDFARENLHPNDAAVKRWSDRDNPNAETFDITGGWYDAGDYGKYTTPAANSVEDLLLAYELYPNVFEEMSLNIPETDPGNSCYVDAPAILSEVKWELDMLRSLEHSSKDGSFYVAANYSDGVIYVEDTLYKTSNHNSKSSETDLRSHMATASAAAVFAHAYIIYKDIPAYADFAEECLETAIRAWDWINDPSNEMHMSISAANRTYTFAQDELDREMLWAAGTLYRAVTNYGGNATKYEKYMIDNCGSKNNTMCFNAGMSLSYGHKGRSFLGYFHYLYGNNNSDPTVTEQFSAFSTWRTRILKNDNWGTSFPDWGYWWGSNQNVAKNAMSIMLGSIILDGRNSIPDEANTSALNAFNYLLGINPISFSYVSGYGENSVRNIYSAIYSKDAKLTPYKCPDGYFTEGSNCVNNRHLSKFDGKCYIDSDGEYTTNENTIYGNASMILLTAAVMSQNRSKTVRGDVNADGVFNSADLVLLQKWLLAMPDTVLADWKAGDLCEDKKLDVFDLCVMRQELLTAVE